MAKKVQLMSNPKQWQVVNGEKVLVDVEQFDLDPITDSNCVIIEGHRTLEETINQENMFTPQITETKVSSKVGGVYHDNVVDGAYEEAILYGNTQVNLLESKTNGVKYIPHSFTSFQGNESKIGNYNSGRTNQVAPLVKGVTMVNLSKVQGQTIAYGETLTIAEVKEGTTYTISFDYTTRNANNGIVIQSYSGDTLIENTILRVNLSDKVKFSFVTPTGADSVRIYNYPGYCANTEETIQVDNMVLLEGDTTDLDISYFKGMRSVELSRPLTNLFTDNTVMTSSSCTVTNTNGDITVASNAIGSWKSANFCLQGLLKPNTKYLVMWDSLVATQTSTGATIISTYTLTSNKNLKASDSDIIRPTLRSYVFDTGNVDVNDIAIRIHATTTNSEVGITTVTGLRVFEWDDSLRSVDLQSLGYFSGTKYISARAIETVGKNLYPHGDINFTIDYAGWCDAKGKTDMYGDIAQKSSTRFLLKKGTYTFSVGSTTNIDPIYLINDKEQQVSDLSVENKTFTLTQDTYCAIRVKTIEANVPTTATNIQIERGETATTCEAYQSRYYKPRETEEIILRSLPNGVCDTFNLQTGELVQRIHSHVFDGATYELNFMNKPGEVSGDDVVGGWSSLYNVYAPKYNSVSISCDIPTRQRTTSYDADYVNKEFFMVGVDTFIISLSKTRLNGLSISQYLTRNPITVQYELAEPIITKLQTYDRVYNGQTNERVSMGNNLSALTYYSNNYYLKVDNLSPVPAILEPITIIPYDVRLKPSTLYTIKYNRGANSNSMSFDLGGSVVEKTNSITEPTGIAEEFTIRTPIVLSHEQLILSGTGYAHNFIVAEGDITGTELPYFEGMKNVKMPIVKNVGKNLLDESTMTIAYQDNITLRHYKAFACKPNTIYHFSANNGETMCNWYSSTDPNAHIGMSIGMSNITYLQYSGTIKTPADCKYLVIYMGGEPSIDPYSIKAAVYEDGSSLNYESHKENSIYITQGEYPITSEMIEQGGFSAVNGATYETMKNDNIARLRSKNLIPVKPNTTYAFAHPFSKFAYNVYQWDGNKKFIDGVAQHFASGQVETITTTADTQYIHFLISKHDASQTITVAEYDWSQFHMYELDSTINLRSLPNGVKDELNLLTGEYIQRVGEKIIDGYEPLRVIPQVETGVYRYINDFITSAASTIATIPQTVVDNYISPDYNGFYYLTGDGISFIRHDMTLDEFYEYLKSNPITVQYELAQPIISYPRIVSNTQEREIGVKLPNGICDTYNPSTGITVKRVGKVVLDGSENWDIYDQAPSNLDYFRLPIPTMFTTGNMNADKETECKYIVSDTFPTVGYYAIQKANSTINYSVISGMYSSSLGVQCLYVYYKPSADLATFKAYLASNPITVWYELKYPQIQPDIVLPNGVHDEYNPETGMYTKKVGFIEFDGSADELWHEPFDKSNSSPSVYNMWTLDPLPNAKLAPNGGRIPGVCDSLKFHNDFLGESDFEMYFISTTGRFNFNIERAKLSSGDSAGLNQYLSQNPIKLWYELETPITYQLTPYFGLPQPYAYEDGYLIHDSAYAETTLPPEFKYKLVANRTGQVMQNNRKLQQHTSRLSNLEALIIEATIESLFNRELQLFELELMDIQLIDLGE